MAQVIIIGGGRGASRPTCPKDIGAVIVGIAIDDKGEVAFVGINAIALSVCTPYPKSVSVTHVLHPILINPRSRNAEQYLRLTTVRVVGRHALCLYFSPVLIAR
jgi:hypothetical protein